MRETELADSLENSSEPKSSASLLEALEDARKKFDAYNTFCRKVDDAFTLSNQTDFADNHFALFWASMEIMKPALYAKPPKPISSPRFKDASPVVKTVSELIERCLESEFDRTDVDGEMLETRDDLALSNRGVMWVTLDKKDVCIEHLDRLDFRHEPARKWSEVGWVARRAWMTKKQMKDRFEKSSGAAYESAEFQDRRDKDDTYGSTDSSAKAGVWEVWSRVDNKVYWVAEGCSQILDEDKPHLNLSNFFPCPKPAYGTRQRRSLIPVPDYKQYAPHLSQINDLTGRIYVLLNQVKLKVLIPAGGDIGNAVETALSSTDDTIVIPVPAAAFAGSATSGGLMMTIPLADVAQTIQGLIEARGQLIDDFYQLSGISDIMRGATEAQETLGAQQLKSQYGSVRVRDKIDELQRIARDTAAIAAEIIAENYSQEKLLEVSQMTIPTKAEVERKTKELEKAAKDALTKLKQEFEENAAQQTEEIDPEQVRQAFIQKQQEIMAQYTPMIRELSTTVVIEDVMKMLRDEKVRNLVIDIETDSTIMTDELAEKQSRNEFLTAFGGASQSVMPLMQAGEAGAKLGGGILKFALQPYRANRELDDLIDDFVGEAGNLPTEGGGEEQAALIAAQNKLAEAEMAKAQAQTMKVQADAQAKMQEIQLKAAEASSKAQADQQKLMLEVEKTRAQTAEVEARIEKVFAEIQKMGIDASNQTRQQDREDVKTSADIQARQVDQAMSAQDRQRQAVESERSAEMSERQQSFNEQQGDRQLTLAERQAMQENRAQKEPAQ